MEPAGCTETHSKEPETAANLSRREVFDSIVSVCEHKAIHGHLNTQKPNLKEEEHSYEGTIDAEVFPLSGNPHAKRFTPCVFLGRPLRDPDV